MRFASVILVLSVASAIALSACSSNTDPKTAGYWLDRLDDASTREEALKNLGDVGDPAAVPEVLAWFNKEGDWQAAAAYSLGQLGDTSVAKDLIDAIDFQIGAGRGRKTILKNRINQNIARALAMLKVPEAADQLINLLNTQELKTREAVIESLGRLGDPKAVTPLLEMAENASHPFIRKNCIEALGELGDPKAVPLLVRMLYIEMPGTSFYNEARFSLQQIGKPAVPLLIKTLQRKNKDVESIRVGGLPIFDGAIEAKAAFVLGALRATEAEAAMSAALAKYYKQYRSKIRSGQIMPASIPGAVMELAYALGNLDAQKSIPLLESIAQDTNPGIRVSATEALTTLGAERSVDALLKSAKSGPAPARRHAMMAVSRLGGAQHLGAWDGLVKSADKEVPKEVIEQVLKAERSRLEAAGECKAAVDCWQKKLAHEDAKVRERAAYQLGWQRAAAAIPDLLKAAEDEEVPVRMAAVLSLAQFDKGVEAATLQEIYDRWDEKITYRNVNAELKRLIARVRANHNGQVE